MATSAVFGTRIPLPAPCPQRRRLSSGGEGRCGGSVIECSSRPQKKATKHHMKTRPRKTQPWDVNRKPTVYPPLPPLPPDWTLVSDGSSPMELAVGALPPPPSSEAPAAAAG